MGPSRLQKQKSPLDEIQRALQARLLGRAPRIILAVPVGIDGSVRTSVQAMILKRVSVSVQMDPSVSALEWALLFLLDGGTANTLT
jgi:hypothetical protein